MTIGGVPIQSEVVTLLREEIAKKRAAARAGTQGDAGQEAVVSGAVPGRPVEYPQAGQSGEAVGPRRANKWVTRTAVRQRRKPIEPPKKPEGVERPKRQVYKPQIPGSGGWKVASAVFLGTPQLLITAFDALRQYCDRKFFSVPDRIFDDYERVAAQALREHRQQAEEDEHSRNYVERLTKGLGSYTQAVNWMRWNVLRTVSTELVLRGEPVRSFQEGVAGPANDMINELAGRMLRGQFEPHTLINRAQDGDLGDERLARMVVPMSLEAGYRATVMQCSEKLAAQLTDAALGGRTDIVDARSPQIVSRKGSASIVHYGESPHGRLREIFKLLDCPVTTVAEARALARSELIAQLGVKEAERVERLIAASPLKYPGFLAAIASFRENYKPPVTITDRAKEKAGRAEDPRVTALKERLYGKEPVENFADAMHEIDVQRPDSPLATEVDAILNLILDDVPAFHQGDKNTARKQSRAFFAMFGDRNAWTYQKRMTALEQQVASIGKFAEHLARTPERARLNFLLGLAAHGSQSYPSLWRSFAQKVLAAQAQKCDFYPEAEAFVRLAENAATEGGGGICRVGPLARHKPAEAELKIPMRQLVDRFGWQMLTDVAFNPGAQNCLACLSGASNIQAEPSPAILAMDDVDPELFQLLQEASDVALMDSAQPLDDVTIPKVSAGPAVEAVGMALSGTDVNSEVVLNRLFFSGADTKRLLERYYDNNATIWINGKNELPAEYVLATALAVCAAQAAGSPDLQFLPDGYAEAMGKYAAKMLMTGMGLVEAPGKDQEEVGKFCATLAASYVQTASIAAVAPLMEEILGYARSYSNKAGMPIVALKSQVLKVLKAIRAHPALGERPELCSDFWHSVNEMILRFLNVAISKKDYFVTRWSDPNAVKTELVYFMDLIGLLPDAGGIEDGEFPLNSPEFDLSRLQRPGLPRAAARLLKYLPDLDPSVTRQNALYACTRALREGIVGIEVLGDKADRLSEGIARIEEQIDAFRKPGVAWEGKRDQSMMEADKLKLEQDLAQVLIQVEGARPGADLWYLYLRLLWEVLAGVTLEGVPPKGRLPSTRLTRVRLTSNRLPTDVQMAMALEHHFEKTGVAASTNQELASALADVLAPGGDYAVLLSRLQTTLRPPIRGQEVTEDRVKQLEDEARALYQSLGLA